MTALFDRYRRVLELLAPRAVVWALALLAILLLLLGPALPGAVTAIVAVAVGTGWRLSRPASDRHLVARAALAVSACAAVGSTAGWTWVPLCVLALVLGGLMAESTLDHSTRPALRTDGLPGVDLAAVDRVPDPMFLATSTAVAVLATAAAAPGSARPVLFGLAALAIVAGLTLSGVRLLRVRRHAVERAVSRALTALDPRYAVYFNGTTAGGYQIGMWRPYLERTGERGVLIIRDPRFFAEAARVSGLPVVLARSLESLEYVAVPGIRAFFYVNNDAKNAHGVRFADVTHVHLGHGDSDKPASYSATFGMFDKIFVAGQAAVDRFAQHGVLVPPEKFVLVGRPQVQAIAVGPRRPPSEHPVVLYAPTWRGGLEDSMFGSLNHGERIVRALLDAGATVWFRPHPYSARDAESRVQIGRVDALLAADPSRPHAGSAATAARTVFECMNASDALVTDISSVASDYLYANKPFAITDTGRVDDIESAYPLARAAILLPVAGDLSGPVQDLLGTDSRRAVRSELRSYYLGDWPPENYSEVFVDAAREVMRRDR
ncbi:CDP-glycerol glycerophosphotransferase family protein [Propionicimonas sp.]|uniref:CDP-glycerol glycerophosphotransferase family protein n=1 Tax=Propionicimonas sp. TaxID=1955623 RepID=UPI0039E63D46